jgi:hypothetical protein
LPPLRPVDAKQVFCLEKSPFVLPAEGAPLVFSTSIAHSFVLQVQGNSQNSIDLPAVADPARGGFVIDTHALDASKLGPDVKGTLRGQWGFDAYEGPAFTMQNAHSAVWKVPPDDQSGLIIGRDDTLHLAAGCAECVDQVDVKDHEGKTIEATWKALKPDQLEVQVPLKNEKAGLVTVSIKQFGLKNADELPLVAYAEPAKLDSFKINAGDQQGVLTGTRLDQVNSFELNGIRFTPVKLARADQKDELHLFAVNSAPAASLQAEDTLTAHVGLKDGRVLNLQTTVEPPRPKVDLVSKTVQPGAARSAVRLTNEDELPQGARMSFVLKTDIPDKFPQTEEIEVSGSDNSFDVLLTAKDGNLMFQNSDTVLAILDPLKSFGPAAFGPLRFRPVEEGDGEKGDWQPLATLVRVPTLKEVRCPDSPDKQCKLSGANLFLIDSVASDPQFNHSVSVPIGFADSTLSVPRPNGTLLYIKLRDDPDTVDSLVLPVLPEDQ